MAGLGRGVETVIEREPLKPVQGPGEYTFYSLHLVYLGFRGRNRGQDTKHGAGKEAGVYTSLVPVTTGLTEVCS